MSDRKDEYKAVGNFLFFKELGTDSLGVNYRAGEIESKTRKPLTHHLVTEVYPVLLGSPHIWKRVNILLEGVRKSNIPKLYSPSKIITERDKTYLVYPLLRGKTFEQILEDSFKKDNLINFDLAFSITFSIADLIDIGSSIVVSGEKSFHGFLTPDNIIVDYDGKIYLKNYGIYPYLNREEKIFAEMVKKYGAWIAPEFLRKEKLVCQTDIYHLGYIVYRILTGKYFSYSPGEDFEAKFSNISFTQHIPSSDKEFLTSIITFFKKTLHPIPSQRFANVKELKDYISNKFKIEELSSVTFNLAYFMNSLYLEEMEVENGILAEELAYTIPEKKKAIEKDKKEEHLVEEILTGLDERKSSKLKLLAPLIAIIVVVVAISAFVIISQQKEVDKQKEQQIKTAQDIRRSMEQRLGEVEAKYKEQLEAIEEKVATTEEEKIAQEDKMKKLKEWQKEQTRKALDKKKLEEERLAKIRKEEEERINKEAEIEKQRLEEQKRLEAEKKKKQEEIRKKLQEEQNRVTEGQLVALTETTEKPVRIKGRDPSFTPFIRRKYRDTERMVRMILLIDETGNVVEVRLLSKPPEDIKSSILRIIKKWKYKPATKNDVKVKVWLPMAIKISF